MGASVEKGRGRNTRTFVSYWTADCKGQVSGTQPTAHRRHLPFPAARSEHAVRGWRCWEPGGPSSPWIGTTVKQR